MFFINTLFLIIAIIIVLLLIKIRVVIDIENNYFKLMFIFLGVIRVPVRFVIKREKKDIFTLYRLKKKHRVKITSLYDIIRNAKRDDLTDSQKLARKKILEYYLKRIVIKAEIETNIGLNNAFATAIVCGLIGVSVSIYHAVIYNHKRRIKINIQPYFSKMFFSVNAHCIIALSPANIIIGYVIYKNNIRR